MSNVPITSVIAWVLEAGQGVDSTIYSVAGQWGTLHSLSVLVLCWTAILKQ